MDMEDAKKFCFAFGLKLELAFAYGRLSLKTPQPLLDGMTKTEMEHSECEYLYECFEEISILTDYEPHLVHALRSNQSFTGLWNPQQSFILAAGLGLTDLIKELLYHPEVDPTFCCNFAVWIASFCENIGVLRVLLADPRVDPSANDNNAFITASSNGALQVMKVLLNDIRVDPSARSNFAIVEACSIGEIEIVEWLLQDPRVDPSASDNLAIRLAYKNGRVEIVKKLLKHIDCGDKSRHGYEPIISQVVKDLRLNDDHDILSNFNNVLSNTVQLF
jgi:hypothetical protein